MNRRFSSGVFLAVLLAWMAVQAHLSAIFVAAPLLLALAATRALAKTDLKARARPLGVMAGVILALQVPYVINAITSPNAPMGPTAAISTLTNISAFRFDRSFETAVQFQFFHGLGAIAVVAVGVNGPGGRLRAAAAWLMLVGTVLFCGSIYARALGAPGGLVAAAPYGGVAFMVAWLVFAVSVWARGREPR